ncbi:hypothetical protein THEYE_A1103 [Thermodesulfovibrio yellowstonii DSM 11347]|uniref:Uncharacterized protein n=1 Tax=Thermodesulfovibrio yellowstonii (strain ATCC 51303 / DSM 11347 / YP87) TaxID=289376 RepID=B5YL12_THEYD|nr:hypothetical protein THEYE_A1103 [Thermodesulfovibrio yellowstonii DSM 11347]
MEISIWQNKFQFLIGRLKTRLKCEKINLIRLSKIIGYFLNFNKKSLIFQYNFSRLRLEFFAPLKVDENKEKCKKLNYYLFSSSLNSYYFSSGIPFTAKCVYDYRVFFWINYFFQLYLQFFEFCLRNFSFKYRILYPVEIFPACFKYFGYSFLINIVYEYNSHLLSDC